MSASRWRFIWGMTVMQDPKGKQSGAPMGLEEPGKTETIR
jgi:hypothetical protein